MKIKLVFILLIVSFYSFAQEDSGIKVLEKSIQYHDPKNHWETFKGTLWVTMKTPKNFDRISKIDIDIPKEYFYVRAKRDTIVTEYTLQKDTCSISFNGNQNLSETLKKQYKLSCKRARMYKDYYTYLYGLPMKLKDKGTIIHEKVARRKFKGKTYLVVKATYEASIGKDTWYFYFNPKTYAMEVYQFFKDESQNDGEYILLTGTEIINGIKMPKNRAWYYNKNDVYLGTDILEKFKRVQ